MLGTSVRLSPANITERACPGDERVGPGGSSTKPSVPISEVKSPDPRVGLGTRMALRLPSTATCTGTNTRQRRFHLEAAPPSAICSGGRRPRRPATSPARQTRSAPGTPASRPDCPAERTPSARLRLRRTTCGLPGPLRRPCERRRARPAPPAPAGRSRIAPSTRRRSGSARRASRDARAGACAASRRIVGQVIVRRAARSRGAAAPP